MTRGRYTKLYPAQIRYEMNNPIVSFRIPRQEHEKLKEIAKNSGRSLAALVRKQVSDASQATAAHKRGYEDGFQAAKKDAETKLQQAREKGYEEGVQTANRNLEIKIKQAREKGYEDGFQKAKTKFATKGKEPLKKAAKQGYVEGYKDARSTFEIKCPCAVCGEMETIYPNQDGHQAIIEYMQENGWGHKKCVE